MESPATKTNILKYYSRNKEYETCEDKCNTDTSKNINKYFIRHMEEMVKNKYNQTYISFDRSINYSKDYTNVSVMKI